MYNYFNAFIEGFQRTFLVNNNIYLIGCFFIINNYMTIGSLLVFVQYFNSFYSSIFAMQNVLISYRQNLPSLQRFNFLLFDIKSNPINHLNINSFVQKLELKQIYFQYPNSNFKLEFEYFKIQSGDRIALIGETGSGKTTLLQILLGTRIPQKGQILINDIDITGKSISNINRVFSVVSQENVFFNMSIRDNFLLIKKEATDEMIKQCCKRAYIWDKISSLPGKLDTVMGEDAVFFSKGERQRLALARAFLNNADIFVLDEITASLDPQSEHKIHQSIMQMPKDKAIIMITHKIDKIASSFRTYKIGNGKLYINGEINE